MRELLWLVPRFCLRVHPISAQQVARNAGLTGIFPDLLRIKAKCSSADTRISSSQSGGSGKRR